VDQNLEELLKAIGTHLTRMCDPSHPVFRLVIEREGYHIDENNQPQAVAFNMKLEHLSGVAHLPVAGKSSLVSADGSALRNDVPAQPVVETPAVMSDLERAAPGEAP
jgi:hypothetical protein